MGVFLGESDKLSFNIRYLGGVCGSLLRYHHFSRKLPQPSGFFQKIPALLVGDAVLVTLERAVAAWWNDLFAAPFSWQAAGDRSHCHAKSLLVIRHRF
jgi:hypothetical protein